jgi:hypothetical protein
MSRRWLLSLLCLSVPLLLSVQLSRAGGMLKVNETATRFSLREDNPRVSLAVVNGFDKPFQAEVQLELLDPAGVVKAAAMPSVKITGGNQKLVIDLPGQIHKLKWQKDDLLWYRLRYRIAPEAASGVNPVYGVISLSEITPELFEIHVASSNLVREGMRYRVTARAQHPLTNRPARGVRLEGTVEFQDDDTSEKTSLKAAAVSDSEGFAVLDFDLPRTINSDDIDLTIKATRGLLTMEERQDVNLWQKPYILVSSDKPIYQPGQTMHARVLIFGPAKRALKNAPVKLKITDPDQQVLFQSELTTSRFGIASADWSIPANVRLGSYRIEFGTDDEDNNASVQVKISRYDLPNFTVNVKPDRSYYLSNENAEVEVSATYLFGQPVKRGQVRVVRETERSWNYREQRYDTKEGEEFAGETDANGVFKTRIDLSEDQSKLGNADYERFEDLRYAAYFTDPTTNRTEQRRFDLRITKEAIHVYIVRTEDRYYDNSHLPLYFYVSTAYADGTPAPCRVTISNADAANKPGRVLRSLKTNRYGLAQVERLEIPTSVSDEGELNLNFLASDSQGKTGKHAEGYSFRDEPVIRVETDKTLYRMGEPVAVTVTSSERNLTAMLEVTSSDWVVQHSEVVRLHDGRATVTLPWTKQFSNRLTILAYSPTKDGAVTGYHTILFPQNRELKLGLQANHKTYRPGQDALLSFRVRDPHGRSAESALGVVVVDKAVAERARTDEEFGSNYHDSAADVLGLMTEGDAIAGIGLRDLNRIDLSQPVAPELELAAEVMLNQRQWYPLNFFGGENYEKNEVIVFGDLIKKQLQPVRYALENSYLRNQPYPVDEHSLQRILAESDIDYAGLRDPWATPFRASFFVNAEFDVLTLTSAGADKRFETGDDFVVERFTRPYFRPLGEAIDRAVSEYHRRTGGFIRDRSTLRDELKKQSIDVDGLRDRWAHPYGFDFNIATNLFEIRVSSVGPNGKLEVDFPRDDFTLWRSTIDYFAERRTALDTALAASLKVTNHAPQNEAELAKVLRPAGIVLANLRDPWGQRYYSTFKVITFYGDHSRIEMRSNYGELPKETIDIKPVTKRVTVINLQSCGPDGREGTADDFGAGSFSVSISEQGAGDTIAQTLSDPVSFSGSTGAIRGILTDANGAAVTGAQATATGALDSTTYEAITDDEGKYLLRNLPPGLYSVRFSAPGFSLAVVTQVLVRSSNVAEVNATLSPGAVSETVNVTASASNSLVIDSSSASLSMTVRKVVVMGASTQQVSTPRLRDYFPETLVWQPSLETDKEGRAQINFKLADNITTWKLAVIGSTEDGQIGIDEKEITAFQPFFVEHDPPRILTEGDEISLPVVVRNYLERAQPVDLELKPEGWFTLLGAGQKRSQVAAGDATRETFDFRASASVKDGKQRITAKGADGNDAIEKPVTVHPDGEERSTTASDIVSDDATLSLDIPEALIPNSAEAELKIYPNLMAHVSESVEAIMRRPYGCGEQTISSTYPSLLLVQNQKQTGQSSPLQVRAERYLREGYSRLLNYRAESGGFTYWGRGEPDLALTAYALRFLTDARELIPVEDDVVAQARSWLVKQQREDGSWAAYDYGDKLENKRRTAMLTAYVARVLAKNAAQTKGNTVTRQQPSKAISPELKRALDYLAARVAEIDEPYLMALYVLAAFDAGDSTRAAAISAKLSRLAHKEGESSYWVLETNTPFYGWGLAGRIETTALVIQAMTRSCASAASEPGSKSETAAATSQSETCNQQLINRGLLFLLRQKDRYGVWYSSQATINVLDAMIAMLAHDVRAVGANKVPETAEIIINGRSAKSVEMPSAGRLVSPLTIDLSAFVQPGPNRIQIRRAGSTSPASVQAVVSYYIPWSASNASPESSTRPGASSGLRLLTKFDRTEGQVSGVISCHVEAERIGFGGYGMLLAEIGLPPGADVDRASLESAMKSSDWAINQYDILPDRVVVYLWPRAGGVKFDFKFRPRFGLKAKTAPSSIYDYYNPEARAVVVPTNFVVK